MAKDYSKMTDAELEAEFAAQSGGGGQRPTQIFGPRPSGPPPRTPEQAKKDAQEALFGEVSPTIQLSNAYRADKRVVNYEESMPLFQVALTTGRNPNGDRVLIKMAEKLTDPTTGVQGQEQQGYAAAQAVADRLRTYLQNELKGAGSLGQSQRRFIREELTRLMLARNAAYNLARQDAADRAKDLNVNPKNVIGTHAGTPYRGFLKKYDINELGIVAPKNVAPVVGPETGGAKTYRFSSEREQEIINYVNSDKFTPTGYADLVTAAATEAGVNVDDKYRQLSLSEGNRLLNAKKEGKPIAGAVSYQKADATYEKQLDEYNKQRAKMEAESIAATPSPYFERFAAGTGLADEASGLGAGLGAVLQGGEFGPAYEMARDAATRRTQLLREQQGGLGMAAELAGGVGAAIAPAGAISRTRTLSQLSPAARAILGETVAGAGLGALEAAPDQRLRGAIVGGAASPAFAGAGTVGQRLGNVIVGGLPANVAPQSRMLMREGIIPTPGQIGQETGGRIGREISLREQAATGVPFVGPAISERRNEGILAANLAAGRKSVSALGEEAQKGITETGLALREQLQKATSDAYEAALTPMRLVTDYQFNQAEKSIKSKLKGIGSDQPEALKSVKTIWDDYVAPFIDKDRQITGESLQAIKQGIQEERSKIELMPGSKRATDIIDEIENALFDGLAKRQAPELYDAYRAADKAYRESKVVANAITSAETKAGSSGVFTPSQLAGQVRASERKFGPSDIGGPGGLSEAMVNVLPATLAESGTSPRAGMMSLLAGGGGTGGAVGAMLGSPVLGAALGLGTAGLASLPYSRAGNKLIAKTLLGDRPAAVSALSKYLNKNPQIGRSLGMAAGLDYVTPEQDFGGRPSMLTPEQQALINIYAGGR